MIAEKVIQDMLNNQPDIPEVDIESIKIGDLLYVSGGLGYGGHFATVEVTKINRKSFIGIECERSYCAGRKWRIHKESEFAIVLKKDGLVVHKWVNV
jgi:hypothetical protein